MKLLSLLKRLVAYHQDGLRLLPSRKDPRVHRWQSIDPAYEGGAPGRDATGRLARGVRSGKLPEIQPPEDAQAEIAVEAEQVARGERTVYYDKANGHYVTSGQGYPPINLASVRDVNGAALEPLFYRMMHPPAMTSGFTMTVGRDARLPVHSLMYNYYGRGTREENGKPNAEHMRQLAQLVSQPQFRNSIKDVRFHRHLGNVVNGGWPLENHMERVHFPNPLPQNPEHARGIERSYQTSMIIVPKPGKEKVLAELYQAIDDHAKSTGYRWMYPDMRVISPTVTVPGTGEHSMLYVPGRGGIYSAISNYIPKGMTAISPDAQIRRVLVPQEWQEILLPMSDKRMYALLSDKSETTAYATMDTAMGFAPTLTALWQRPDRMLSGGIGPLQLASLHAYDEARTMGMNVAEATAVALDAAQEANALIRQEGGLEALWQVLATWFDTNELDGLDWDDASAKLQDDWDVSPKDEEAGPERFAAANINPYYQILSN